MKHDLGGAGWWTSGRSGSEGNCVEVATNLPDVVAIRDTKNREHGVLAVGRREWKAFVAGVRSGEFDL